MSSPTAHRDDTVDLLHGRQIADPYRWLEDPDSPATRDWVESQQEYCEQVFAGISQRDWFTERLGRLVLRPRQGVPFIQGGWYLVTRNDGHQNQDVWYAARSLDELLAGGQVVIDPNTLSADGSTSVPVITVAPDGDHFAVVISEAGSDWLSVRFLEARSFTFLSDQITTKFAQPVWMPDSRTVLWTSWPDAGRADGTDTTALAGPHLRTHTLGESLEDAADLLSFPDEPQMMTWPLVAHPSASAGESGWLVVHSALGTEAHNAVQVAELTTDATGRTQVGELVPVIPDRSAAWEALGVHQQHLYLRTDDHAPLGRVVRVDLADVAAGTVRVEEVIGVGDDLLETAVLSSDGLLCARLIDAVPRLERYGLDGAPREEPRLNGSPIPGGAVVAIHGDENAPEVFVGLSSVTSPTTSYRVDMGTGRAIELTETQPTGIDTVTQRHRAISADGASVPYFVIRRADVNLDQPRPTLLYGYGGFSIPVVADYRPGWPAWLEAGGVLVIANLRGGGEFGTEWAEAGKKAGKQRVFDDVIAVAEDLIARGITTTPQLALHGRSNGGLLVGAAITQRPDLFGVGLPQVGVLDLLRFHRFTFGAAWISDYGDPDDADDFDSILTWSPLHRIVDGAHYPPTMVVTADHDDRVVPAHSYKFAATLQHAQGGTAPIVCRIESSAGHGSGKPLVMVVSEWADLLAFAAHFTGLRPEDAGSAQ